VERGDGVVAIVLAAQERGQLELVDLRLEGLYGLLELPLELGIGLLSQQLVDGSGVGQAAFQGFEAIDVGPQAGQARGQVLATRRVVPQGRIGNLPLQLGRLRALRLDVKGTPWRMRCAWTVARCAR
jgi:hypothetical protein